MAPIKILMLAGDYVEEYEVMAPFQALLMAGHTVHAVCPDGKAGAWLRAIRTWRGCWSESVNPARERAHPIVVGTNNVATIKKEVP